MVTADQERNAANEEQERQNSHCALVKEVVEDTNRVPAYKCPGVLFPRPEDRAPGVSFGDLLGLSPRPQFGYVMEEQAFNDRGRPQLSPDPSQSSGHTRRRAFPSHHRV